MRIMRSLTQRLNVAGMHWLAYLLIVVGAGLMWDAARDEQRGIATVLAPARMKAQATAAKVDNPERFRELMTYQWVFALFPVGVGAFLLGMIRRADRLDPFSRNFVGLKSLEDLQRTLAEEGEKRRRPLR
jgi:hypothetical protein